MSDTIQKSWIEDNQGNKVAPNTLIECVQDNQGKSLDAVLSEISGTIEGSIGNGTITITQNGVTKGTFTTNQSGNTTVALTDNNTTYSNATTSANGLMSSSDKSKLDTVDNHATNIPFIVGTQTTTTGTWTGTTSEISTLVDGQTIRYWLPYNASGSATLNLTLSNGSKTGAIDCYWKGTNRLTTHYTAGSVITLTYRTNVAIAGSGSYTGWWADADYNADTLDRALFNATIKCGTTAIVAGNIIVGKDGIYSHLKTGNTFDITYPILYANASLSASSTGYNNYLRLPMSITATQSISLTVFKPIFIKGNLSGTIFTPISTTPLTQTIPTSADGYEYILLGIAYSTTTIYLFSDHPIFAYKGGAFGQISSKGITDLSVSGKVITYTRGDGTTGTITTQDTTYTHPTYTAMTGVPTANQTPAFGGAFTVTQPVSDATGHITAMNSRTITIPNTVATSSTLGLVKSGTDITVDSSGNVSVNDDSHNHVISNVDGLQTELDNKVESEASVDFSEASSPEFQQGIDDFQAEVNGLKSDLTDYLDLEMIDDNTVTPLNKEILNRYIDENGFIRFINQDTYSILTYTVKEGNVYNIAGYGKVNVSGFALICFNDSFREDYNYASSIIEVGNTSETSYNFDYTPQSDGVIIIANTSGASNFNITCKKKYDSRRLDDLEKSSNFVMDNIVEEREACSVSASEGMYIEANGVVKSVSNTGFIIWYFRVDKGYHYHIKYNNYKLFANYVGVAFSTTVPTVEESVTAIEYGSTVSKDIDLDYVPSEDGYIYIARAVASGSDDYTAEVVYSTFKKPNKKIKIQVFGDSISDNTWGDNRTWVDDISNHFPDCDLTIVNSAVGGKPLANWNSQSVSYLINDGVTLQTDSDFVVVFAGTNDWAGSVNLGEFGDTETSESKSSNTFSGGVTRCIKYLSEHTKAIPIFVTPIQRYNSADAARPTNDRGEPLHLDKTLREFCNREIEICEFYGIPCLDLYSNSCINRLNINEFTIDGLHPNNIGDSRLAKIICNYIKLFL